MMYRSLLGFAIVMTVAGATGHLHEITTRHLHLQVLRNIFHFTGQNLWFYALGFIPLAHLFALEFTSPLWVMLLAAIFLGEQLTRIKGIAAGLAFIGVLLIVRPQIDAINIGHITAALSAIGFAITAIFTKKLTRTETITCILFYLTLVQLVLGVLAAGYDGDIAVPSGQTAPWVLLVAIAGLVAHFCLTTALRYAPASMVMPMDFVRLPVIAVVGFALYQEPLEAIVIFGAGLILTANWMNIRSGLRPVK